MRGIQETGGEVKGPDDRNAGVRFGARSGGVNEVRNSTVWKSCQDGRLGSETYPAWRTEESLSRCPATELPTLQSGVSVRGKTFMRRTKGAIKCQAYLKRSTER